MNMESSDKNPPLHQLNFRPTIVLFKSQEYENISTIQVMLQIQRMLFSNTSKSKSKYKKYFYFLFSCPTTWKDFEGTNKDKYKEEARGDRRQKKGGGPPKRGYLEGGVPKTWAQKIFEDVKRI